MAYDEILHVLVNATAPPVDGFHVDDDELSETGPAVTHFVEGSGRSKIMRAVAGAARDPAEIAAINDANATASISLRKNVCRLHAGERTAAARAIRIRGARDPGRDGPS